MFQVSRIWHWIFVLFLRLQQQPVLCCTVLCSALLSVCNCMLHASPWVTLRWFLGIACKFCSYISLLRNETEHPNERGKKNSRKAKSKPYAELKTNWVCVCVCAKFVAPPGLVLSSPLEACEWFSSVQFSSSAIFIYIQSTVPYAVYPLRTCCSATPHRLFTLCAYGFWASRHTHYR